MTEQLELFVPPGEDLPLTHRDLLYIIEAAGYDHTTVHKFQHLIDQLLEFTVAGIECETIALEFEMSDLGTTTGAWIANSIRTRNRHEVVDNDMA